MTGSHENAMAAFVAARLDEDEQAAEIIRVGGFHPPTWSTRPGRSRRWMEVVGRSVVLGDSDDDWCDDGLIALVPNNRCEWEHIARHDPARVLAEVAAKRRVLARHPGATATEECPGCGAWLDGTWRTGPGQVCPELADLALPYAGHKDYAALAGEGPQRPGDCDAYVIDKDHT